MLRKKSRKNLRSKNRRNSLRKNNRRKSLRKNNRRRKMRNTCGGFKDFDISKDQVVKSILENKRQYQQILDILVDTQNIDVDSALKKIESYDTETFNKEIKKSKQHVDEGLRKNEKLKKIIGEMSTVQREVQRGGIGDAPLSDAILECVRLSVLVSMILSAVNILPIGIADILIYGICMLLYTIN